MKLATLALGLALAPSLAAASEVKASLLRNAGFHRIEVSTGAAGWTLRSAAAQGVHVIARRDGSATVLVMDHALASGSVKLVMEKDGETREVQVTGRIKA